jgi:hypothetical protein
MDEGIPMLKGIKIMKKKSLMSIIIAICLSVVIVGTVIAGTTRDSGTLETEPADGLVNWTAWLNLYTFVGGVPTLVYPPEEIMTEDSFNAVQGPDGGYTDSGWQIQVRNFTNETNGNQVNMVFCGINLDSGKNWEYDFLWDGLDDSTTEHGEVPLLTDHGFAAPRVVSVDIVGDTKVVSFYGEPETTFQVYRSTSPAAVGSDRSNGRYKLQGSATTYVDGLGTFVDSTPEIATVPSWYVVMYFPASPDGPFGCHSEEPNPTSVRVINFSAKFISAKKAVDLTWETDSNEDLLGFALLRNTEDDISSATVIEDMIAVIDPGGTGAIYDYTDETIELGETYYYWLQIIEGSDRTNIGSLQIRTSFEYYMPLFSH